MFKCFVGYPKVVYNSDLESWENETRCDKKCLEQTSLQFYIKKKDETRSEQNYIWMCGISIK